MKIDLFQYSPVWQDKEKNMEIITSRINEHSSESRLIIFPEMTLTGFTMKSTEYAENIEGESIAFFINLARKMKKNIFAGIIEEHEHKIYNTLFHFDEHGLIHARYRKIHPYSYSGEDKNFSAGDETVITNIDKIKIGLSICYDLRFPELYRKYIKEGVDIMVNIASWPDVRISHWQTLLRARAIENQCFMIGVNRTGEDPALHYNGFSTVYDPMGTELITSEKEEIISVDLDIKKVQNVRNELPFLTDIKLI